MGTAALAAAALVICATVPMEALAAGESTAEAPAPAVVTGRSGAHGALRYDTDYPAVGYSNEPARNQIARLQSRLERGEVQLKFQPPRGYLDSVLAALGIDPSSQTLVYSKTSLQFTLIRAATPRAIYFNDDTYVAWIPGTRFLEIATMDDVLGPVFYTLSNDSPAEVRIDRETSRCLTCHDTWGMAGGGVPRFLFLSTLVDTNGEALTGRPGEDTTDQTPIRDRWAGWYVTGMHGKQQHLGNILAEPGEDPENVDSLRRGNLDTLQGLFDTGPYLTARSDIVALLVFEHQAHIGGYITRANFKSRTLLARNGLDPAGALRWSALPPTVQKPLKSMLEALVRGLLFVDASGPEDKITSTSGFDRWFEAQGPRDPKGRSLRELDLRTRLFKYPLSYLVYSGGFEGLPGCDKEYVYTRLADILSGRDNSATYAHLSPEMRADLLEILSATKPPFAERARERAAECERDACAAL
ncbi:MAG TPA: hypothetical protein VG994_05925 [Steroidobacteraceae bacterium]|nr:hypothetical protein [Steroidobacteraceae bacterium]